MRQPRPRPRAAVPLRAALPAPVVALDTVALAARRIDHELHGALLAVAPRPLPPPYRDTLTRRTRPAGCLPDRLALSLAHGVPAALLRAELHAAVDRALDGAARVLPRAA